MTNPKSEFEEPRWHVRLSDSLLTAMVSQHDPNAFWYRASPDIVEVDPIRGNTTVSLTTAQVKELRKWCADRSGEVGGSILQSPTRSRAMVYINTAKLLQEARQTIDALIRRNPEIAG